LVKSSKEVIKNKSSGVWICEIQHLYIPIVLEVGFSIKFAFYKKQGGLKIMLVKNSYKIVKILKKTKKNY